MKNEKSELREIVDLFEDAGFTVTYYFHYSGSRAFEIGLISNKTETALAANDEVDCIHDICENENAAAGKIEKILGAHSRIRAFTQGANIIDKYAGTIYIRIEKVPAAANAAE